MQSLSKKEVTTRRSLKYTYYASSGRAVSQSIPALLFLHGFPDSAHLWSGIIDQLSDLPNKIIAPDCLGYAGTDKPAATELYAYKDQANDLIDILDGEGATHAIIVGHDWGSALAQRTYLHHRRRFSGVVLLNTAYMVPSNEPFDLSAVNALTEKAWGYPQFAYWEFFLAPDAASIIDANLRRMWQALHGDVDQWMKRLFCVPGAMRSFLLSGEEVPLKPYACRSGWQHQFMAQFQADGFASALQMYKATALNIQSQSDADIARGALAIEVPTLFIVCSEDAVCSPQMMEPAKAQHLVPNLTEVVVQCAHWSPMEKPEEIAGHIRAFVTERLGSS